MKKIIPIIIICLIFSCSENKKNSRVITLKLPDTLTSLESSQPINISKIYISDSLFIFTSINTSCSTCLMDINKWREFQDILKNNNVALIPICHSNDNFEMLKYLFDSEELESLDYPLFLDPKNKFLRLNDSLLDDHKNITVITNVNKEIILQGNPFQDQNLMDAYLKTIEQ